MRKPETITISEYELPVTLEKEKTGGYIATCPAWNDCYAQGDSIEEALSEITAVAASLIELYKEENLTIPLQKKQVKEKSIKGLTFNLPLIISSR